MPQILHDSLIVMAVILGTVVLLFAALLAFEHAGRGRHARDRNRYRPLTEAEEEDQR